MKTKLAIIVATGLGVGFIPLAPGTWGSILALPLCYYALKEITYYCFILAAVYLLGIWSIKPTTAFLGTRKNSYQKMVSYDQSQIVIDEILGMLVSFSPLLFIVPHNSYLAWGMITFLFRVFDILKPWPIKLIHNLKSIHAVMSDDALAGVYTALSFIIINLVVRI